MVVSAFARGSEAVSSIDWEDIDSILAIVMELPENARAARVYELCGDCVALRAEIESLLAAHQNAGGFLAVDTKISSGLLARASLSGRQLGSYRLLEVIGAGGMGTVYRAERTDGQFRKHVAIKV